MLKDFYRTPFAFLCHLIKPYRWWYVLILQAPILTGLYVFANNYSLKLIIDAFSKSAPVDYHSLLPPIILFICAQIWLDLAWRISNIAEWKAEPFVRQRLLLQVYDYIQHHSFQFFQNTQGGTIISKLKGILDGYDAVFSSLHHTIGKSFAVVFISILVLLFINTTVFLFMLCWCVLVILILFPMGIKLNKYANAASEAKHQVIGRLSDNITNIFSLFYFAKRQKELHCADQYMNCDYVPRQIAMYRYDFKFNLVGTVLYWFMLVAIFLFMIYLRQKGEISTGDLIFVMLTALAVSFDLWAFVSGMCDFSKQMGDFKSSFSILQTPHDQVDAPFASDHQLKDSSIEFKHVGFGYQKDQPIFTDLNLQIKAGEKIGLIGHSGAGKSTLISLLLKNFTPDSGHIVLGGYDLQELTADAVRRQISLIPQDIVLFHRSIGENIAYAKEHASLEEVRQAAKLANIDTFIESLPEQYETKVGERGLKLSGGQRQRIAIARAILKNAPILILDEATASLDTITEQQIQQSINNVLEKHNCTIIAIAHRLSTIRHMDRIIVMDEGKIIEQGSFYYLMEKNGYFKSLWDTQVNGMVL